MTASNALRASVNQYECSIATPRSNCACTLASQDVGNATLPSLSWANPGAVNTTRSRAIDVSVALMNPPLVTSVGDESVAIEHGAAYERRRPCVQCISVRIIYARGASSPWTSATCAL